MRIPSHGGSGTVIQSLNGHSLILTCAHLFTYPNNDNPDPNALAKRLEIDVPYPMPGAPKAVGIHICDINYQDDLALLEINAELPYFCKIASADNKATNLLSVGFDKMQLPGVRVQATLLGVNNGWAWTKQLPIPGRSGGGLLDLETGTLVGVCHGFTMQGPYSKGMYVPLYKIRKFVIHDDMAPSPGFNNPGFAPQPFCPPGGS